MGPLAYGAAERKCVCVTTWACSRGPHHTCFRVSHDNLRKEGRNEKWLKYTKLLQFPRREAYIVPGVLGPMLDLHKKEFLDAQGSPGSWRGIKMLNVTILEGCKYGKAQSPTMISNKPRSVIQLKSTPWDVVEPSAFARLVNLDALCKRGR